MSLKKFFLPLLGGALILSSCGKKEQSKPLLVTSIYPLTWTVKELYPTYEVYQILKAGQNPHLYDLSPRDAQKIEEAKKVFLIGNLEPYSGKVPSDKKVKVIKLLGLDYSANPHFWFSPKRWLEFVEKLPQKVKDLKLSEAGYKETVEKLRELDKDYSELKRLKLKAVMVHPAFVWLCKDYGVEVLGILEKHGGIGISPKTLVDVVQKLKTTEGKVLILYISVNPKSQEIAEKIAKMAGSKAIPVGLDPILWKGKGDYTTRLENNLKKILNAVNGD
jgi:ABC-type Zn uptake system ZnuABC Zn-binding protein ZnuA